MKTRITKNGYTIWLPESEAELNALVSEVVLDKEYRPVPAVRINGEWRHVTTWLNMDEDPADPRGGRAAGDEPPLFCQHFHQAEILLRKIRQKSKQNYLDFSLDISPHNPGGQSDIYQASISAYHPIYISPRTDKTDYEHYEGFGSSRNAAMAIALACLDFHGWSVSQELFQL